MTTSTYPIVGGVGGGPASPQPRGRTEDFQTLIERAVTKEEMLDVWRRVVTEAYQASVEEDPQGTFAVVRAQACMNFWLQRKFFRALRARYYRSWPDQSEPPATSGRRATSTVTIRRVADLDFHVQVEPKRLLLDGPQGRVYRNRQKVEWLPYEGQDKDVVFEAENIGFFPNLDHIADGVGTLTRQDGTADTDAVSIQDASKERSGERATIALGAVTTIKDAPLSDRFFATDVGLYVRVDSGANAGRILRIAAFEESAVEAPAGFFARSITVVDTPQVLQVNDAHADDGGVLTDQTAETRDYVTADDMTLLPAAPVAGDAYYFGGATVFAGVRVFMSTSGRDDWVGVWEYWNGAAYVALVGVVDGTNGFREDGDRSVTFTVPGDWAADTINTVTAFHVRFRLTTVTTVTRQPLGRYAVLLSVAPLTADSNVEWTVLDFADLGLTLFSVPAFEGGRDNDLYLMGDDRGLYQQTGETDAAFAERAARLDDNISPNAINRAVNRLLEPFGETGLAFDIGKEAPRERVYQIASAQIDDGGVFTDQTAEAQDHSTADDMTLLPPVAAVGDAYYFGGIKPFTKLKLQVSTAGVGDWTLAWEYWDGSSWAALSNLDDPSGSFKIAGSHSISFDEPAIWSNTTINTVEAKYIRARVTAVTVTTTQPLGQGARLVGLVVDQVEGFFWDVDFLDYYDDPSDSYPVTDYKLLLSENETRGWFFVLLPFVATDDASLFFDDGPITQLPSGEWVGPAWDAGFYDKSEALVDSIYASIYEQLLRIRAGGHGFTLIRTVDPGTDPCP